MIGGGLSGAWFFSLLGLSSEDLWNNFMGHLSCLSALLDAAVLALSAYIMLDAIGALIALTLTTPIGWFAAVLLTLEISVVLMVFFEVELIFAEFWDRFFSDLDECLQSHGI